MLENNVFWQYKISKYNTDWVLSKYFPPIPNILYTYVRICALHLMHSMRKINGLINDSGVQEGGVIFCMYIRTHMSLYLWATQIYIERIKNLVAPALIIERTLPCN